MNFAHRNQKNHKALLWVVKVAIVLCLPIAACTTDTQTQSYSNDDPRVIHVADLPVATLPIDVQNSLAYLDEDSHISGYPESFRTNTNVSLIQSHSTWSGNDKTPNEWQVKKKSSSHMQKQAVFTISKGDMNVDVSFKERGISAIVGRFLGGGMIDTYGYTDLNSRYLALEGSGDWNIRFIDKIFGTVLPIGVKTNPNHLYSFFVDRQGNVYIEIALKMTCTGWFLPGGRCSKEELATYSTRIDRQADGIRKLEFGPISVTAPLTQDEIIRWDEQLKIGKHDAARMKKL